MIFEDAVWASVSSLQNQETKAPATLETAKVVYRTYELGVVCYYVGLHSNVLELTPPLILSHQEAEQAITILDKAIQDVEQGRVSDEKISGFKGW